MYTHSSILYHTAASFAQFLFSSLGKGKEHAISLYKHFMKIGSLEGFIYEPQAKELIDKMRAKIDWSLPSYTLKKEIKDKEATKFFLEFEEGLRSESVVIPMRAKQTLCISSQIGCKQGCAFCETGRMGLIRSLNPAEIMAQVFVARHVLKQRIDNIVFMGMGEPLDNLDAVLQSIAILTDPQGLGFAPSDITVSTSGLVPEIDRCSALFHPAINLAVSINAPTDEIRRKIMPVNRMWDLSSLYQAMLRFCNHPRRKIFIEYVLLEGINDSLECADALAKYLEGLRVKVNLIPYNPQRRFPFATPSPEKVKQFSERMRFHGYLTLVRQTKGDKERAACGQLGERIVLSRRKPKESIRISKESGEKGSG